MRPAVHLPALTALGLALGGCSTDSPSTPTSRFAVRAAALTLGPIGDASYAITVRSAAPAPDDVVWSRAGLASDRYGDGAGAPGPRPRRVSHGVSYETHDTAMGHCVGLTTGQ